MVFFKSLSNRFWQWYVRHYALNLTVAAVLFTLQLVHLYWLTTDVVLFRILGEGFFPHTNQFFHFLLVFVDYTEIPAIITTSLVYIESLRKGGGAKDVLYLVFLNSQWLHIFWITDEVVLGIFGSQRIFFSWHPAVAWIAIAIDYLELPVIFDTLRRVFLLRQGVAGLRRPEET